MSAVPLDGLDRIFEVSAVVKGIEDPEDIESSPAGQSDKAIEQYQEFLYICSDADPGIDMINDAKERLARLKTAS